jgi:predicted DCC family thiol-disulfide oxidoreductase YuxK
MADLPDTIIFFDGACLLCDRAMQWMVRHDPLKHLHYAPLGGETFQVLMAAGVPIGNYVEGRSMLLARRIEDGAWTLASRSDAVIGALETSGGAPRRLALLRLVPRPLRNLGYRAVAAIRYRLFGRIEACSLANGAAASRLLP